MSQPAAPKHTNRLVDATSPYLLQHAHNPVDWYPWGEEALARAQREDKPILLSIGYSACHWCHVMAHESFEDEELAAAMNAHFVNVKVDREERPDLDDIYMAATLAMNQGQGGWPMTVFLTPAQKPFFAGTYFPPEDRWGRPGFRTLLARIAELWRDDRETLVAQGERLVEHLRDNARPAPGASLGEEELRAAVDQLAAAFDERHGGFGPAPKFPPATSLRLLLRAWKRFGDEHALTMARRTLEAMARGGMYDQVGGGFCRYSTDERWLVPHFEKMLYDNALLARAYLEGFQATGEPFFERIAREILDYVLREMTATEGGFYSATDADSEGEEGKFFVWTPDEIEAVVGAEDAELFCDYYDVSRHGNWEGKSIPNVPRPLDVVARLHGLAPETLAERLEAARAKVYAARLKRVAPGLDDKVLTAWNGLMIGALAEAHRVLGEPRYLAAAERATQLLLGALRTPQGRLLRTYRCGRAHLAGYLEDYAYLADALVDLYEAGASERYLDEAERLVESIRGDFAAEGGGFFSTAAGHEALIVRHREGHDGATPAANAVAAHALARLGLHRDRAALREEAARALRAWGRAIARQPRAFAQSLLVVDLLLDGPVELAFVGARGDAGLQALRREVARHYLPNRIVAHHDPAEGEARLPLVAGKTPVDGAAALYVCRGFACRQPVTRPADVAAALGELPAAVARVLSLGRSAGRATAGGTAAVAAGRPATFYARLGATGLTVSRIGFGGYRVDDETPEHREALRRALASGCNLIDTSTNYTDGGSERLVGEVLADAARAGGPRREQVVVVSKIGYVQGTNYALAERRRAEGRPFPEVVEVADGLWHCLHPEFLEDQLERSLDRLRLEGLDVLLLHNPEYFLKHAHERRAGSLEERRREFYRRLEAAFAFLERQVEAGRLGCYGVSSNTCVLPADDPEATSLAAMLAAARRAGGEGHGFRVLQLPMNLVEVGAALERNNDGHSVLELAAAQGLGVLVNRPLNAMDPAGGLLRLAAFESRAAGTDLDARAREVEALEDEFRDRFAARLQVPERGLRPEDFFRWGGELPALVPHLTGVPHWDQLEAGRVMPRLLSVLRALDGALAGPLAESWSEWRQRYLPALEQLLAAVRARSAVRSEEATRPLREALLPRLPEARRGESFSRLALWVLLSTPGVTSVLVGMRRPAYVEDAQPVGSFEPLEEPLPLLEATAASARSRVGA